MNGLNLVERSRMTAASLFILGVLASALAQAGAESRELDFVTHAAFFSAETHQASPLDPQVFVASPATSAAMGPQGINHSAGVRNALVADNQNLPISNAQGKPLGMTLGAWLAAKGKVILSPLSNGQEQVKVILSGLKPNGHYSLFENHFDQKPVGFTPLDGQGSDNNFIANADGNAIVTTTSPSMLTHDNAVLVVYHSDEQPHGMSRGAIGVDAHHQLIARP